MPGRWVSSARTDVPTPVRPPVGTIGLTHVPSWLHPAIRLGHAAAGDWSEWTHAFVVIDRSEVFEARPGGARIVGLDAYLAYKQRSGVPVFWLYGWPGPSVSQAAKLDEAARSLVGAGYSWLDYVSLAALRFGLRPRWIRHRVATSGRLICSQAVDELYRRVGIRLFDDGRSPGDVTPADLANGYLAWSSTTRAPGTVGPPP